MRVSRPASAITVIGAALLWSTMAAAQDRSPQDRPALVEGRPIAAVEGVWRSRGYGYVVVMGQDGPAMFHVAGDFCYADPRQERDPDGLFAYYRPLGRNTVAFSGEPGQTRIVFDRLRDLPAACGDTGRWSPARIAALTAATFADLYPSFAERGIDWRARTAAVERAGNNEGGPRIGEREWQPAYRRGVLDTVLQGKGHQAASGNILWGRVGDIGYLNLMSMSGDEDAFHAALDQAMTAFKGARGVIVDVTNNRGGTDSLTQQIAGRFAAGRRLAYTKVAYGARDVEPQPFHVEP